MIVNKKSLVKHRIKLLVLIVVFLSPYIGGWMALYVFDIRPENKNYGSLVIPPVKVSWPALNAISGRQYENGFGKKWTFLLLTREACGELCRSNLFYMRQIRTLLGRDIQRLQNVLISEIPVGSELTELLSEYPRLEVIENLDVESLFSQFETSDVPPVGATPRLYLVDPDQNYMMYYPAQNDHYRILEDIKKLLKLSQIG